MDYKVETANHMMFHCRVSKEICSLVPSAFNIPQTNQRDLLYNNKTFLDHKAADDREMINFFVGW